MKEPEGSSNGQQRQVKNTYDTRVIIYMLTLEMRASIQQVGLTRCYLDVDKEHNELLLRANPELNSCDKIWKMRDY